MAYAKWPWESLTLAGYRGKVRIEGTTVVIRVGAMNRGQAITIADDIRHLEFTPDPATGCADQDCETHNPY